MGRIAVVAALLLAVCAAAAPAGTEPERVYALLDDSQPAILAEVDARTLKPVSAARVALSTFGRWSYSPNGKALAVSTGFVPRGGMPGPVQLRFVDLVKLRLTGSVRLGPDPALTTGYIDPVVLVAWLTPDTVVAVRQRANRTLELAGVETTKRTVRWRKPLSGVVLASAPAGGELVLLVGKEGQIVAPRIVVVDARGRVRSVELSRLRAGWTWDAAATPPVGETRHPGLTVDPATRTAFVAAPSGLVAEIALDGLGVRYHALRGTLAKYQSGAIRQAVSLGRGVLAVAGTDMAVRTNTKGELVQSTRGSGLELVDTGSGTTRSLDSTATTVAAWEGGLVAASWNWDSGASEQRGGGLAIYDKKGLLRFRLFEGRSVSLIGVHGSLAYAYDGERVTVDLVTGRVVSRAATGPLPLLR
jgi:hypothetical protein